MRKLTVSFVVGGLLASVVLVLAGARVSLGAKVAICHVPPGNPGNTHVIKVGPAAVKAHVKNHGDAVCAGDDRDCCLSDAGALCTNLADDPDNCGECGNSCGEDQTCEDGACVCEDGLTACEDSCVDTSTDPDNCGECGHSCGTGEGCEEGECVTTLCSAPGSPGWGNQVHSGFGGATITADPTPQACCLSCVADPNCLQWAFPSGDSRCQQVVGLACHGAIVQQTDSGIIRCP